MSPEPRGDERDPASPRPSDPDPRTLDERIAQRRADEEGRFAQMMAEHFAARAAEQEELLAATAREAMAKLEHEIADRRSAAARELEDWRRGELARVERELRDEERRAEERIERHRQEVERDLSERLARHRRIAFDPAAEPAREAETGPIIQTKAPPPVAVPRTPRGDAAAVEARTRLALARADTARELGRILRDAVSSLLSASAFAVVIFHPTHDEVVYRYRVRGADELSIALGTQPVDESRDIDAVRSDRPFSTFVRTIRVGSADERTVAVAQIPLRDEGGTPIGIATLQAPAAEGFGEAELALVADLVIAAAPRFAEARRLRRFRDPVAS